ncbi:MAG: hypothetical protein GY856_08310, partial [bacterium]|nr:hypothetical protein [bacterium]
MSRTSHIEQLAVYVLTFVLLAVVPGMPAAAQQTPASTAGADTTLQDDAPPPAPSIPAPATAPDPEEPPIRLLATGWLIFGLRVVLVCLLSSFMAITARSFLRTRLRKKEYEYTRLLALLGVDADDQRLYSASIHDEYDASDYVLPVAFATLASLVGFVWIVFGNEIANAPTGQSVLLTGPGSVVVAQKDTFPEMARAFRHRSVMVLGFSFLGAFLWSAQNITRRLVTVDLQPSAYYSAALRIFLANFTALVLAWLLGDQGKLTEGLLPAVAFLTGMLPEQ